jgi:hypothetical protein
MTSIANFEPFLSARTKINNGFAAIDDLGQRATILEQRATDVEQKTGGIISPGPGFGVQYTITVGAGGDFATINEAIEAASRIGKPRFVHNTTLGVIRLNSGFVMQEQVFLRRGIDLSAWAISSQDAEVTIDRASLTEGFYKDAFIADEGSSLPWINTLFTMNTSGSADGQGGIAAFGAGARAFVYSTKGFKNVTGRAFHIANGALGYARGAVFTGAGEAAVRVSNAFVEVRNTNLSGSGIGLKLAGMAVVDADGANCNNCTLGIESYESNLRFTNATANTCGNAVEAYSSIIGARLSEFDSATGAAILLREGCKFNARSCSIAGAGINGIFASGSEVFVNSADISGAGSNGVSATASRVVMVDADVSNAGAYGVLAEKGSHVAANGVNATGAVTDGFMINDGSFIDANGTTGTYGRTINTWTRHGFIAAI